MTELLDELAVAYELHSRVAGGIGSVFLHHADHILQSSETARIADALTVQLKDANLSLLKLRIALGDASAVALLATRERISRMIDAMFQAVKSAQQQQDVRRN